MQHSTTGSILRSTQALCDQLCEKKTLEYGIAYGSKRFAALPEANQFREVIAEDPDKLADAFAEAQDWFRGQGLVCLRWAPADGQATPQFSAFLEGRKFRARTFAAMRLTRWPKVEETGAVRILHARAVRKALRQTFLQAASPASKTMRELQADACEERLDDPQFDLFVALVDGQAVGRCALFQVGDIARVMEHEVLPGFDDRGVDRALLNHVVGLAKRLGMHSIVAQADNADAAQLAKLEQAGFAVDGTIVEFEPDDTSPAAPGT